MKVQSCKLVMTVHIYIYIYSCKCVLMLRHVCEKLSCLMLWVYNCVYECFAGLLCRLSLHVSLCVAEHVSKRPKVCIDDCMCVCVCASVSM